MKKVLALIAATAMCLATLTACGGNDAASSASANGSAATSAEDANGAYTLAKDGVLTMATNAYFPPYEYYEGEKIVGIDAEIAGAVAEKLGLELKIEDMEFDAIVNAVKSGKADFGAAGMTVTEDRKKSVDFTDPYTTAEQVIIVQK